MEYPVKQIQPNHADHISYYREDFLKEMLTKEVVIAQPKYDGERMLIHFDGPNVYCTSRRFSKKTDRYMENQDRLPYLKEDAMNKFIEREYCGYEIGYTVLDCECYAKNWSEAASVLHSLPERAKELQDTSIEIKYAVFDCLFFDGQDLRDRPYIERLEYMYQALNIFNCRNLKATAFMASSLELTHIARAYNLIELKDVDILMNAAINRGYEGIVIKSLSKTYYEKAASLKCKKFETVDCVVIDYQQGRGKYENTIGALIVGYYDKDKNDFVQISKVNCSTDVERDWWRDNWESAKHSVIEVKCQEITDRSLRHPVYIRRRDDKTFDMCTRETIFKE